RWVRLRRTIVEMRHASAGQAVASGHRRPREPSGAGAITGTGVRIEYYADAGRSRQDAPDGQSANPRQAGRNDRFLDQSEQQELRNDKIAEKIQRAQCAM